jgi:hypothetical protein
LCQGAAAAAPLFALPLPPPPLLPNRIWGTKASVSRTDIWCGHEVEDVSGMGYERGLRLSLFLKGRKNKNGQKWTKMEAFQPAVPDSE